MSTGRIVVDNSVDQATLQAYAGDPDAVLDVTGLDLGRLPPGSRANLHSEADTFSAPHLRTSGNIDAPRATVFSAPKLRASENINATHADVFEIPRLRVA